MGIKADDPRAKAVFVLWNYNVQILAQEWGKWASAGYPGSEVGLTEPTTQASVRARAGIEKAAAMAEAMEIRCSIPPTLVLHGGAKVDVTEDSVFAGLDDVIDAYKPHAATKEPVTGGSVGVAGAVQSVRALSGIPKEQLRDDRPEVQGLVPESRNRAMALGQKGQAQAAAASKAAPANAAPATAATPSKAELLKAQAAAKKADKETAAAAKAAAKVAKVKKVKEPGPCLDGCGAMVTGRFQMGHDAKLKSLLLKIERGDEAMASVPDVAAGYIKFKKGEVEVQKIGGTDAKVQLYTLTQAPVRLSGRPEVSYVEKLDDGR